MSPLLQIALLLAAGLGTPPGASIPPTPAKLAGPIAPQAAEAMVQALSRQPGRVREIGRSAGGRPIWSIHFPARSKRPFKALLVGQQHGNEVSGKDTLLCLMQELTQDPDACPADLDLTLIPSLNPDGWASGRRTNDAGADLNRDHLLLRQPETLALHRFARELKPHLVVDLHEYTRDNRDHAGRGWLEWPLVTVDSLNNPMVPLGLRQRCLEKVERAPGELAKAGHDSARYLVGGAPPDQELRPSTLEADDLRNALGSLGAHAYIIEAAIQRSAPDPQKDLAQRSSAVRAMLLHLLGTPSTREEERILSERARQTPLPPFIPVNQFWSRAEGPVSRMKVIEQASGRVLEIPAPNVMTQLSIKRMVATPQAYLVEARSAELFRSLCDRNGISYELLKVPETHRVEGTRLLGLEEGYDEVNERYGGRAILKQEMPAPRQFDAGSLRIPIHQAFPIRVLQLLEPNQVYGLYQHSEFRASASGTLLPVWRELPIAP